MPHVNMTVSEEPNAFGFEHSALAGPSWSSASGGVHHSVAWQALCLRRIAQGASHHARVAGPACPCRDGAVGGYSPAGNLPHDVEHCRLESTCLLAAHLIGVGFHVAEGLAVGAVSRRDWHIAQPPG